ncbi:hypothetical protein BU23DRAFT_559109 [Bimuria novae-zelandiae CBS 107.79]|uniref:HTH TFE/IIEalpha-type domain-containing protein n=1 Tax=Bimuria novae-zelandiae CBS 107.79 TaxID=1447943 RepID=A0A6A5V386_9PLEO|nr:hypothetical protein BU23DRAFT_559109 [Bimuria novae-zelandiae CBS 107.79]
MDALELGKVFVKTVVRMFYETEHIVVIDALVYHGALHMQDLVLVLDMGKSTKQVGKYVGKLKEAGLISIAQRQETREGALKAVTREYYYIDYRRAIDSVKYKIHKVDSRIKKDAKPTTEKMEYRCKNCSAEFTQMDVLDNVDPMGRDSGFCCKRCHFPLTLLNDDDGPEPESDDTPAKFNKQFKPILDLMQQIDTLTIPHIEGKDAIEGAVELPRDKDVNPGAKHEVVQESTARPMAVRGTNTVVEKIEVQIASNSEYNEAARAAEKARQEKIATQNQLPSWHVKSTVDKSQDGSSTATTTVANGTSTPTIKTETVNIKPDSSGNLDDVFAQLAAERAKQEEEEDDEEDEDEDEFEDAMVDTTPEVKRVKLESSAAPTPTNAATPAISTGDGGDESDEDEFEDVN